MLCLCSLCRNKMVINSCSVCALEVPTYIVKCLIYESILYEYRVCAITRPFWWLFIAAELSVFNGLHTILWNKVHDRLETLKWF